VVAYDGCMDNVPNTPAQEQPQVTTPNTTRVDEFKARAERLLSIQKDLNRAFEGRLIHLTGTKIMQTLTNEPHDTQ